MELTIKFNTTVRAVLITALLLLLSFLTAAFVPGDGSNKPTTVDIWLVIISFCSLMGGIFCSGVAVYGWITANKF